MERMIFFYNLFKTNCKLCLLLGKEYSTCGIKNQKKKIKKKEVSAQRVKKIINYRHGSEFSTDD